MPGEVDQHSGGDSDHDSWLIPLGMPGRKRSHSWAKPFSDWHLPEGSSRREVEKECCGSKKALDAVIIREI